MALIRIYSLGSGSGASLNLGNSDLTQTDTNRVYTIGDAQNLFFVNESGVKIAALEGSDGRLYLGNGTYKMPATKSGDNRFLVDGGNGDVQWGKLFYRESFLFGGGLTTSFDVNQKLILNSSMDGALFDGGTGANVTMGVEEGVPYYFLNIQGQLTTYVEVEFQFSTALTVGAKSDVAFFAAKTTYASDRTSYTFTPFVTGNAITPSSVTEASAYGYDKLGFTSNVGDIYIFGVISPNGFTGSGHVHVNARITMYQPYVIE